MVSDIFRIAKGNLPLNNVKDFTLSPENLIDLNAPTTVDFPTVYQLDYGESCDPFQQGGYFNYYGLAKISCTVLFTASANTNISITVGKKRQSEQEEFQKTWQTYGGTMVQAKENELVTVNFHDLIPVAKGESIGFFLSHNEGSEIEIPVQVMGIDFMLEKVS